MTRLLHLLAPVALSLLFSTAEAATAVEMWERLPPKVFQCWKLAVESQNTTIEAFIATGAKPDDPRFVEMTKTCQRYADGMRQRFECDLKDQSGNPIKTLCREYYVIERGGQWAEITDEEALKLTLKGQNVQVMNTELLEGLQRRQNAISQQLNSSSGEEEPLDQALKAEEEQRQIEEAERIEKAKRAEVERQKRSAEEEKRRKIEKDRKAEEDKRKEAEQKLRREEQKRKEAEKVAEQEKLAEEARLENDKRREEHMKIYHRCYSKDSNGRTFIGGTDEFQAFNSCLLNAMGSGEPQNLFMKRCLDEHCR